MSGIILPAWKFATRLQVTFPVKPDISLPQSYNFLSDNSSHYFAFQPTIMGSVSVAIKRAGRGAKLCSISPPPYSRTASRTRSGGKGLGFAGKRIRKVSKDTIEGITKGDIKRLARRGGVKRMGAGIYHEARMALKIYVRQVHLPHATPSNLTECWGKVLQDVCELVKFRRANTVTVNDVLYALRLAGRPIWGFEDVSPAFDRTTA
jgi:histone H4